MVNETILAIIIAFAISAALCPVVIPFLHRLKFGQQVRDDGPQSHLKKQGTPTMGGLIILTATVITSLFYIKSYPRIIPILFVTVGFGIIGFLDDYIKIVMKRSEGLNPIQKLIGQFIITGIFTYYLMTSGDVGTGMLIPFTGGFENGYYLICNIILSIFSPLHVKNIYTNLSLSKIALASTYIHKPLPLSTRHFLPRYFLIPLSYHWKYPRLFLKKLS